METLYEIYNTPLIDITRTFIGQFIQCEIKDVDGHINKMMEEGEFTYKGEKIEKLSLREIYDKIPYYYKERVCGYLWLRHPNHSGMAVAILTIVLTKTDLSILSQNISLLLLPRKNETNDNFTGAMYFNDLDPESDFYRIYVKYRNMKKLD